MRWSGSHVGSSDAFHWKDDAKPFQAGFEAMRAREHLTRARELRQRIREADDSISEAGACASSATMRDRETDNVRLLGDLALAAFFEGAKPKQREDLRRQLGDAVQRGEMHGYVGWLEELAAQGAAARAVSLGDRVSGGVRPGESGVRCGGGESRRSPGSNTDQRRPTLADSYPRLAQAEVHEESERQRRPVVAHFFRRAFGLLRTGATSGLIATNTIAQGDTRSTGLRWICNNGGEIYRAARRRVKWPGLAAVVVSVLHVHKGALPQCEAPRWQRRANAITAFLLPPRAEHDDPARLECECGQELSVGSIVLGMGFTFDDTPTRRGSATPLAEMHRLIEEEPHNRRGDLSLHRRRGGEFTSPTHAHHRYVINFRDYPLRSESDAGQTDGRMRTEDSAPRFGCEAGIVPRDYPVPVAEPIGRICWRVVEEKVKARETVGSETQDARGREAVVAVHCRPQTQSYYAAMADLERALANFAPRQHNAAVRVSCPAGAVYSDATIERLPSSNELRPSVPSNPILTKSGRDSSGHRWKDDLRYTPSDCFETFPFPVGWDTHPGLESAGTDYYHYRADLMVRHDEGLTKTYNRFHDPDDTDPEIANLRDLHTAMDRAVLDAYGWTDIPTDCEFLLDYEIDEEDWGTRKKPYRYRWPNEVR